MKRIIWLILAVFISYGASDAQPGYRGREVRNFNVFYTSLKPHGEWISGRFGTAWRPFRVGHQWRPYLNGHWIWTDYGWYWSSYEPFGWATYHYGRWTYDDYYGWIWIPGDEWGPAWVEWRYDNDYIGWAPLPPSARWSFSVGITFGRSWIAPVHYWNFVPCGNFSSVSVVNYIQPPDISRRIYGRTRRAGSVRSVENRVVNDAVRLDRVQRRTTEPIRKVDLTDRNSPGEDRLVRGRGRETLEVYRPGRSTGVSGSSRSPGVNDTRRNVQPEKTQSGRKGLTNPRINTDRKPVPRKSPDVNVAPKGKSQPPEIRSRQQSRRPEIRSRNQERPARTQVQRRSSATKQRPSVRRSTPSRSRSGSGKSKRKPDG